MDSSSPSLSLHLSDQFHRGLTAPWSRAGQISPQSVNFNNDGNRDLFALTFYHIEYNIPLWSKCFIVLTKLWPLVDLFYDRSYVRKRNGRNKNIRISITDIANQTVLCVMYMIVKAGRDPNPLDTGDDISVGGEYCLVLLQSDKLFSSSSSSNK